MKTAILALAILCQITCTPQSFAQSILIKDDFGTTTRLDKASLNGTLVESGNAVWAASPNVRLSGSGGSGAITIENKEAFYARLLAPATDVVSVAASVQPV